MYTGDLAQERIGDMVRDAENFRRTRETRSARAAGHRGSVRRIAVAAATH